METTPFSFARISVVLFDRDGTLVYDNPALRRGIDVHPISGVAAALARLRAAGILLGLVSNQPRIGLHALEDWELWEVHAEMERLLGPFDDWAVCPHKPNIGCLCRKPMPGLILAAARRLGRAPQECLMIGDIGSDMIAAARAGAAAILVPTSVTRKAEIDAAPMVASDVSAAVERILGSRG